MVYILISNYESTGSYLAIASLVIPTVAVNNYKLNLQQIYQWYLYCYGSLNYARMRGHAYSLVCN